MSRVTKTNQTHLWEADLPVERAGSDEMNLVELPMCLPRTLAPNEHLTTAWEEGERSYSVEMTRVRYDTRWTQYVRDRRGKRRKRELYASLKAPEDVGLPGPQAMDIYVMFMRQLRANGFTSPTLNGTRYYFLQQLKWNCNQESYEILERTLNQMTHSTTSSNAIWSPKTNTYHKGAFNMVDSFDFGPDVEGGGQITVGQKFFKMLEDGYIKELDTAFFSQLSNPVIKKIYRWVDKHLGFNPKVEIDVLRFAHKQLGIYLGYKYPSQVRNKLAPMLDELQRLGFCRWDVEVSKTDSKKKFVFYRVAQYKTVPYPSNNYVLQALEERGVVHASKILDQYGAHRCLLYLEYYEYRIAAGMKPNNAGAYIAEAIRKQYRIPQALEWTLNAATMETRKWIQGMINALTPEELEQAQAEAIRQLHPSKHHSDVEVKKALSQYMMARVYEHDVQDIVVSVADEV